MPFWSCLLVIVATRQIHVMSRSGMMTCMLLWGSQVLMSKCKWSEIDYSHVASVCFKRSKKTFEQHDKDRLVEYLARVKKGEVTINAGALKPHEIVKEAMQKAG